MRGAPSFAAFRDAGVASAYAFSAYHEKLRPSSRLRAPAASLPHAKQKKCEQSGRVGRTLLSAPTEEDGFYFAFEKSSTANIWPLRSATPMPAESMSPSRMLARCCGDFMKLW